MARKKKNKGIDSLKGKVLVAKVGKDLEFQAAFKRMTDIANGILGWDGQAELMVECGLDVSLNMDFKGTKKQRVKRLKEFLQQSFLQELYEYGEWIPEAEAETRRKSKEVLFGSDPAKTPQNK